MTDTNLYKDKGYKRCKSQDDTDIKKYRLWQIQGSKNHKSFQFSFVPGQMETQDFDNSHSSQILPVKSLEGNIFTWGMEIINGAFYTSLVFKNG